MSGLKVGVRLSPFTVRLNLTIKQNNLFYVTVTKLKLRKFPMTGRLVTLRHGDSIETS